MNGLEEQGFLSPQLASVTELVNRRYRPWLAIVHAVSAYAVAAQYSLKIRRDSLQELVAACLYVRTLTTVQAAVLLAVQGSSCGSATQHFGNKCNGWRPTRDWPQSALHYCGRA